VGGLLEVDDPAPEAIEAARRDLEVVDRQMQTGGFLLGAELYLCDLFLAPMIAFVESSPAGRANVDSGRSQAMHDVFWRRTKELEHSRRGSTTVESDCGKD